MYSDDEKCANLNGNILWSGDTQNREIEDMLSCLLTSVMWEYIAGNRTGHESNEKLPLIEIFPFSGYELDSLHFSVEYSPSQIRLIACGNTISKVYIYQILL